VKRHLFGIALFIAIVSFSAFIYEYFQPVDVPDCASAQLEGCGRPVPPAIAVDSVADDVTVNVDYVEASMRTGKVNARLNLTWQGFGDSPRTVWVQLHFHNFDGSQAGWTSDPIRVSNPFGDRGGRVVETSFDCAGCTDLPRNLYAGASLWRQTNVNRQTVYRVGELTPVVVQEKR
jgi:hypothetical protein